MMQCSLLDEGAISVTWEPRSGLALPAKAYVFELQVRDQGPANMQRSGTPVRNPGPGPGRSRSELLCDTSYMPKSMSTPEQDPTRQACMCSMTYVVHRLLATTQKQRWLCGLHCTYPIHCHPETNPLLTKSQRHTSAHANKPYRAVTNINGPVPKFCS